MDGTQLGSEVRKIIGENEEVFSFSLTIAEVVSKVARRGMDTKIAYDVITNNSKVVNADKELSLQAGLLHAEIRKTLKDFSMAEAHVLAAARRLKAKVLTGNLHFKDMSDAIIIK